ncbi:uracil-DNA glycosylase [Mycetocola reblochoni]|uniref:Uracil-DNA glycosylase n=1 Tax=Mycetocola reblochoni TaxID=331618 RepID=A0A3L6ZRT8_9MICO|nr:uracil-DNA glycosylase [Mycetocola reblochoni]
MLRRAGVHESWHAALLGEAEALEAAVGTVVRERAAGRRVAPDDARLLRAFSRDMAEVRVVILGQDPYPGEGHAVGLSFSVAPRVRPLPRSLANIYRELHDDLGIRPVGHGDLSSWFDQGVLLLNRVLSVEVGAPGSHRGIGWERVTGAALAALSARGGSLVAILWGRDARSAAPLLPGAALIESPHPSPLSASRGFFGSAPFSRANTLLRERGAEPIDWSLPPAVDAPPTLL